MKQNVLHITSGNLFGGIETNQLTLAKQSLTTYSPHGFFVGWTGQLSKQLEEMGAPLSHYPSPRISRPWTVWKARQSLRRISSGWNAIVVHGLWAWVVFGPLIRKLKLNHALWIHDGYDPKSLLGKMAARHSPNRLIANSQFIADQLKKWPTEIPISILHCAVFPGSQSNSEKMAIRKEFGFEDSEVIILCSARIEPWKGQAQLIKYFSQCRTDQSRLCIVGAPQRENELRYMAQLKSQCYELGLSEKVCFLGHRSNADVRRLMSASDIYAQANCAPEPFGIVFVEALYHQTPVLTFYSGGAIEIVDDTCGVLVDNEKTFVVELDNLIQHRATRERLALSGPVRAKKLCDPQQQLLGLESILAT